MQFPLGSRRTLSRTSGRNPPGRTHRWTGGSLGAYFGAKKRPVFDEALLAERLRTGGAAQTFGVPRLVDHLSQECFQTTNVAARLLSFLSF